MITPAKAVKNVANTYTILNKVGSHPKYSAIPAHTPAIIRLEERVNFFSFYLLFMTFMGLSSFHALIDKSALRKDIIISWYNSISYIFLLPAALYINSINKYGSELLMDVIFV